MTLRNLFVCRIFNKGKPKEKAMKLKIPENLQMSHGGEQKIEFCTSTKKLAILVLLQTCYTHISADSFIDIFKH